MGEEEEDVDEEDEEALGEEEEGDGEIFLFVVTQPRHFVLHIPNTPPHHHLCSTKKGQKEIDCVSSKSTPIQMREMPDQFPTIHKTTEHPLTKRKKSIPRDGVFSHLKQKTDKNKNFPYKSNEKNSLHYSVFVSLS